MKLIERIRPLFFEIVRFGIVGAIAFLFDLGAFMLVYHLSFGGVETFLSVAVSTTVGFALGVTINYLLSIFFVFRAAKKGAGKDKKSAVVFLIGSIIGLILTQLIMNVGVLHMGYNEVIVKIAATFIVMFWNYISRKLLIFRSK